MPEKPQSTERRDDNSQERVVVDLKKRPTRDISLEEIQRAVKSAAKSGPWKVGLTIAGFIVGGGGGGLFAHYHGDDEEGMRRENRELHRDVEKLRDKLQQSQIDIARCCP